MRNFFFPHYLSGEPKHFLFTCDVFNLLVDALCFEK